MYRDTELSKRLSTRAMTHSADTSNTSGLPFYSGPSAFRRRFARARDFSLSSTD